MWLSACLLRADVGICVQNRAEQRQSSGKQAAVRAAHAAAAARAWEERLAELNADLGTALR